MIARHTVSVDDLLEGSGEFVDFEVSWRLLISERLSHGDYGGYECQKSALLLIRNPYLGNHC